MKGLFSKNNYEAQEDHKRRKLYYIRELGIIAALISGITWIMILAYVLWLGIVMWMLRNDWKTYRKIDIFTIIYIVVMSGIIVLIGFHIISVN